MNHGLSLLLRDDAREGNNQVKSGYEFGKKSSDHSPQPKSLVSFPPEVANAPTNVSNSSLVKNSFNRLNTHIVLWLQRPFQPAVVYYSDSDSDSDTD